MSKLTLLALAIGVGALFLGGVIEVNVHPQKLGNVPGAVGNFLTGNSWIAKGKAQAIKLKRKGELYLAESEERKMRLLLAYIEGDTKELTTMLDEEGDPDAILAKANLLADTIAMARDQARNTPDDVLADITDTSSEVLTKANTLRSRLTELRDQYEEYQERLAGAASTLENELGSLRTGQDGGEVAGEQDEQEEVQDPNEGEDESSESEDDTPTPRASPVPLRF